MQCKKGAERKQRKLAAEEANEVTSTAFSAYGLPLEMVKSFKYLGRVLSAADNDWTLVVQNLAKVRMAGRRMSRILIREGARPQVSIFFFKSVIQLVLLLVA